MSWWTYAKGIVEVVPLGRTQAEKSYILETVINHLPRVTGSEEDMNIHTIQKSGYNLSDSCDEFSRRTHLGNGRRGNFELQQTYYLLVEGSFRDRMFKQTYREMQKWLCRLAKRVSVQDVMIEVEGWKRKELIRNDNGRYTKMCEPDSWDGGSFDDGAEDTHRHVVPMVLYKIKRCCPLFARYTADWDTFNFEQGSIYERRIKACHYAFDANDFMPCSKELVDFERDFNDYYLDVGYIIMEHEDTRAKRYIESYGFETIFEGHKAFAVNSALISSDFFKSIDATKYDIFIGFSYKGDENKWEYQLRSAEEDKVNVAEIAVKHGGGGHFNAAGFRSNKYELGE